MMLSEITPDLVQGYYQQKQLDGSRRDGKPGGLSPKTIRNHHMLLKDFFTYAVKKYKLEGNPAHETNRPEVITPKMRVLLFPSKTGTHIAPRSFALRLTAVSKRCEIKQVNPHALRHTFATRLVEENVRLTTLMELLGHLQLFATDNK